MPAALRTYADVRPGDHVFDNFKQMWTIVSTVEEDGPETILWVEDGTLTAECDHLINIALDVDDDRIVLSPSS